MFRHNLLLALCLVTLPLGCGNAVTPGGYLGIDATSSDVPSAPPPQTFEASIGPAGGKLTAGAGPLAGFVVQVPAGAVQTDTLFRCVEHAGVVHPLYAGAGPAAHCTPDEAPFDKEVLVTLPYDDARLPTGGATALSGLQQTATGAVDVVDEVTVDLNASTIAISLWSLGVLQPAKVQPTTGRGG